MSDSDLGRIVGGKYELRELAGEGGMATVWKGVMHGAAGFSRAVAIKKMKPEFRAMRNYIDMFVEEARVGAEMNHANIVQVIDFLQDDEHNYYMVMEWVDGIDLFEIHTTFRRSREVLPWGLVAIVGIGALRALAAAHERVNAGGQAAPIIHRDVSPQNLLLSTDGDVKLSDFGLALANDRVTAMTSPGMVKGKLSYLAPEIVVGSSASPQTDTFAVGIILWESLAGRQLFSGADNIEVYKKVRDGIVPPLEKEREGLPASLVAIVNKALAHNPDERFSSAREFAHALSGVLGGAQSAGEGQLLLARAVRSARIWMGKDKSLDPSAEPPQLSWEEIELQFSSVCELVVDQDDPGDIDIWFSKADIKK
ncbi:MAG: serine/threonine protein kinase [Myxococcales bacterium]|nr:serine/threonine protein kinase [Myxococcales bacterium]